MAPSVIAVITFVFFFIPKVENDNGNKKVSAGKNISSETIFIDASVELGPCHTIRLTFSVRGVILPMNMLMVNFLRTQSYFS